VLVTNNQQPYFTIADAISVLLRQHLGAGKKVLWLVPGGSAIAVVIKVAERLIAQDLSNLSVTLTDERYGDLSHADSNWHQLEDLGFQLERAKLYPVLTGDYREQTTKNFASTLRKLLTESDYRLGFFGIGPDGHTAGILPGSPAVDAKEFAAGYTAPNFERITMTPLAIAKLDEAVVYAMGAAKWPILEQLQVDLPLAKQPAQALKQVPQVTIFNDHIDTTGGDA
jgi:6-phosphogluconolactonase/glucosamine-6-phosphate isomerase/deaminase